MATVDTIVGRITIPSAARIPSTEAWQTAYIAALDEALAATDGALDVGDALSRQLANDREVMTSVVRRTLRTSDQHRRALLVLEWLGERTAALPRWRSALSPLTRDDGVAFIQNGNLALRIKRRQQQETATPEAPPQQGGAAGPLVIGALLLAAFFR